jgi:demethylmenaquinone methyltransferase/2-methoxy-6-polyprenyl-1,4-benzoquinol methylase
MTDLDSYLEALVVTNPLLEPAMLAAVRALQLPPGSRGLDAGCGIGQQAMLLAEAVGPGGGVAGLDLSPEFLVYARRQVAAAGFAGQIAFESGDVRLLPFADDSFDWAWSANCVGYAPLEPLPLVLEMRRVVKPGGLVAILAWSSQTLLPGHPLLEARLNATAAGLAPFAPGMRPELHFLRLLGWLRQAGLEDVSVQTFSSQLYAPLSEELRRAVSALFAMRWPGVEDELAPEQRLEFEHLCLPGSPDFLPNHPDYYAFFTYSMFCGRAP